MWLSAYWQFVDTVMLSVAILTVVYAECCEWELYAECCYAMCHYAECHHAECNYAECNYAECNYAECNYAECRDTILKCSTMWVCLLLFVIEFHVFKNYFFLMIHLHVILSAKMYIEAAWLIKIKTI